MKASGKGTPRNAEEKIIKGLENFADALADDNIDLTTRFTCRKVVLNLEPFTYTPEMVKAVRKRLGVSQTLFAQFIGASKSWVQAWERGDRDPSPVACRFMDEIMNEPELFRKRFLKLVTPTGAC